MNNNETNCLTNEEFDMLQQALNKVLAAFVAMHNPLHKGQPERQIGMLRLSLDVISIHTMDSITNGTAYSEAPTQVVDKEWLKKLD